tara:strand:+ start:1582 stop:1881 length:300 start_codon:yes stop_codon:yes gene_type:complete
MKRKIFNQYVSHVTELFRMDEEDLFKKSKKRERVDARHMLYYLCATRPMRIRYIEEFMKEKGYIITHSTIIHGIKCMEEKMDTDKDYTTIIKKIELCVD